VTTRGLFRALAFTGRVVPPVVATTAVVGLGIFAWRAWLRLREEERWLTEWAAFQHRQSPDV
jgi:hypothetical protein